MSKEARINRCKALYEQFLALNPHELETFPQAFADFDGPNLDESKKALRFVLETLDGLNANDAWTDLPWHTWNSLEGQLQNLINLYNQLKSSRDQGSFQNFSLNLDGFAYHLRMFGLPFLSVGGASLEKTSATLSSEVERVTAARTEIEKLREEVKALITRACPEFRVNGV